MSIHQINLREDLGEVPQSFIDYLDQNWSLLAAAAYHGYQKCGRGLLWVDWLNQLPIESRISDVSVIYCTPHSSIARRFPILGMSDEVRRLVRQYDPESMLVIRWDDGKLLRTRTIGMLGQIEMPRDAYEKLKGRLSEFELLVNLEVADG